MQVALMANITFSSVNMYIYLYLQTLLNYIQLLIIKIYNCRTRQLWDILLSGRGGYFSKCFKDSIRGFAEGHKIQHGGPHWQIQGLSITI